MVEPVYGGGNMLGMTSSLRVAKAESAAACAHLVVRLDKLNVGEWALDYGFPRREVRLRGVRDRLLQDVLPRLDEDAGLAAEVSQAVSPEAMDTLLRAAPIRRKLEAAIADLNRRSHCSRFGLYAQPWDGVASDLDARLDPLVSTGRCPAITAAEVAALRDATTQLRAIDGLEAALSELLVHGVRPFAIAAQADGADVDAMARAGWAAAMQAPTSRYTARALVCSAAQRSAPIVRYPIEEALAPEWCAEADLPAGEAMELRGLPTTLPLMWAGR